MREELGSIPPHSIEAEKAVLGSILIDGNSIADVSSFLEARDFYRKDHATVYAAMLALADRKEPIDVVTVAEELMKRGTLAEIGGAAFISNLSNQSPTSLHVAQYGHIIERKALFRRLIVAAGEIARIGHEDGLDVEDALDRADASLKRVQNSAPKARKQPDPASIIARMENAGLKAIPTRWPALNNFAMGYTSGQIWVVGGFTSMGKSQFAVNAVDDVIRAGGAVMVASLEMTQEQYMLRLISLTSGVPQRLIRRGGMNLQQAAEYDKAKAYWKDQKVVVYDDLYNATRILRMARKAKEKFGHLDLLVVDFLQNFNETGDETKDVKAATIQLQQYAKELDCCVLALSQVSNDQAIRQQEDGTSSNYFAFKGSGAIGHAADLAIVLDRDKQNAPSVLWMHVVKNRHDEMGKIACNIDLPTGRITQMTSEEAALADPNSGRRSKKGGSGA